MTAVTREVLDAIRDKRIPQADTELFATFRPWTRTPAEISAGVTPVNYAYAPGRSQRHGLVGDGVTDDYAAFQRALDGVGDDGLVVLENGKNYRVTQQLAICTSGGTGARGIICEDGVATITFDGLSSGTDCILIGNNSNTTRQPWLKNLILDAQGTAGRDILSIRREEHGIYENLYLKNSVRDAFSMCPQADFDQVENPHLHGVHVQRAGRHAFAFIVGAATSVGPFVNELTAVNCEVRGCSWKQAGGVPFYYKVSDNHGGAGIQDHTWIGCNVNVDDGQAGSAPFTPGTAVVYLDYDAAGSNVMTHLDFHGGGWETSTGAARAGTLVKAERNASLGTTTDSCRFIAQNLFNIDGIINPGQNWTWDEVNSSRRNGVDYRISSAATIVFDPGAAGSGVFRMDRSAVQKGQVVLNNEFGQGFWDAENSLNFRKYAGSVSQLLIDFANTITQFAKRVYLPQDSGAAQTSCATYAGTGAPSNANGANGDYYFRSDTPGTANQRIYVKSAGAWVGIV